MIAARALKKAVMAATAGLLAMSIPGWSSADCVHGNGDMQSETRPIGDIDSIDVDGAFSVEIAGAGSEVVVQADSNIIPLVVTETSGSGLKVTLRRPVCVSGKMHVKIPARGIRDIRSGGAVDIDGKGLAGTSIKVELEGAGSALLAGEASRLEATISGASNLDARDLRVKTASVEISGAGDATVNASDTLDVSIMGAGNVKYVGRPEISRSIMGVGNISRLR